MTAVKQKTVTEIRKRLPSKFEASQRRKELRDRAVAYLGGHCAICYYDRCSAAFDIHHIDPSAKEFTISSAMTSWERIAAELGKCVLLCARCHREVHDGWHPSFLSVDGPGEVGTVSVQLDLIR